MNTHRFDVFCDSVSALARDAIQDIYLFENNDLHGYVLYFVGIYKKYGFSYLYKLFNCISRLEFSLSSLNEFLFTYSPVW